MLENIRHLVKTKSDLHVSQRIAALRELQTCGLLTIIEGCEQCGTSS